MQCPRTHATDGEMLFLVEEFLSPYQKISDRRTSEPLFSQRLSTIVLANLPLSLTDTTSVLWFRAKQWKNWRWRCYKSCVRAWSCKYHPRKLDEKHRALAFFKKKWTNSPGWRHLGWLNARGGDEERGQMPCPWYCCLLTLLQTFINQWTKQPTAQYFNTMVLKTSRATVHVSWFWLYCIFLYILFFTVC